MMTASFIKIMIFLNIIHYSKKRSYYFDRRKRQNILHQQLLRLRIVQHVLQLRLKNY